MTKEEKIEAIVAASFTPADKEEIDNDKEFFHGITFQDVVNYCLNGKVEIRGYSKVPGMGDGTYIVEGDDSMCIYYTQERGVVGDAKLLPLKDAHMKFLRLLCSTYFIH